MPLQIIRQDITKITADAVVNPTNKALYPTGGTDAAIHKAAGPELLKAAEKLSPCPTGEVRVADGYNLNCKHVIFTVGPVWHGGVFGEKGKLISCYKNCLTKAQNLGCESIAIPLVSSGSFGYPKDQVLKIAINTISDFLLKSDMLVYLCVFDKKAYELSEKVFKGITAYIDDFYVLSHSDNCRDNAYLESRILEESQPMASRNMAPCSCAPKMFEAEKCVPLSDKIDDFIKLEDSFTLKLLRLIDSKGIDDVTAYKKANVSKQTWYKIMNDENYKPNKKTVISFAIALKLTLDETQSLLESVGFILSKSNMFDVIIIYCISHKIYDVLEVDSILFKYDQETLFSKA